jgi:hypothetical protein
MRFHVNGHAPGGSFTGTATNGREDPARAFCDAYRQAAASLLDPSGMRLEPVFWGGQPADGMADAPLRCCFSAEEEPGIFAAVFGCLGWEPSGSDAVVMMPHRMALHPVDAASLLPIVIQDAASILTDECEPQAGPAWAAADLLRAATAAVLTRAAVPLFPGPAAAAAAYEQVCASAFNSLVRHRYSHHNGSVLLVRENPGLVTAIGRVVRAALAEPPLALPADAAEAQARGGRNLAACASMPGMGISASAGG